MKRFRTLTPIVLVLCIGSLCAVSKAEGSEDAAQSLRWTPNAQIRTEDSYLHDLVIGPSGEPWALTEQVKSIVLAFSRWDGQRWETPVPLTNKSGYQILQARLHFASSGDGYLAWSRLYRPCTTCAVASDLQGRSLENGVWGPVQVIASDSTRQLDQYVPEMASGGGRSWLVWRESDALRLGRSEIGHIRIAERSNGSWVQVPGPSETVPGFNSTPKIRVDRSGRPHVLWVRQTTSELFYSSMDSLGAWTPPLVVNQGTSATPYYAFGYDLELGEDGRVDVMWVGSIVGSDGLATKADLFHTVLTPQGGVVTRLAVDGKGDVFMTKPMLQKRDGDVWCTWKYGPRRSVTSYLYGAQLTDAELVPIKLSGPDFTYVTGEPRLATDAKHNLWAAFAAKHDFLDYPSYQTHCMYSIGRIAEEPAVTQFQATYRAGHAELQWKATVPTNASFLIEQSLGNTTRHVTTLDADRTDYFWSDLDPLVGGITVYHLYGVLPTGERRELAVTQLAIPTPPLPRTTPTIFQDAYEMIPVSDGPSGLVKADINRDGQMDFVIANTKAYSISILYGSASGLGDRTDLYTGKTPGGLAVGDLNGDTYPDIVVCNLAWDSVTVLIQDDSGGFSSYERYCDAGPVTAAVGDFNGDSQTDILVGSYDAGTISYYPGNGDGTFKGRQHFLAGAKPHGLIGHNLNDNAFDDIVLAADDGHVSVFLGNATRLGTRRDYGLTEQVRAAIVSDVDSDLAPDLVATTPTHLVFMKGDLSGTFRAAEYYEAGNSLRSVVEGDFNGDLVPDFAISNGPATLSVLFGDGRGVGSPRFLPTGRTPMSVVSEDINRDGWLDLVTASLDANCLSIHYGDGADGFGPFLCSQLRYALVEMKSVHLDGDFTSDLVTLDQAGTITVLRGTSTGFVQMSQIPARASHIALGDINNDGRPDLVASSGRSYIAYGFQDLWNLETLSTETVSYSVTSLVLADLDGDGNSDIFGTAYQIKSPNRYFFAQGNGDGSFQPAKTKYTSGYTALEATDLDGDRRSEVLVRQPKLGLLRWEGDGVSVTDLGRVLAAAQFADLNSDGRPDLIGSNAGKLLVWQNTETGLLPPNEFDLPNRTAGNESLALADFDRDGRIDVALGSSTNPVHIVLGTSDQGFAFGESFIAGPSPQLIVAADLDQDDWPDLTVGDRFGATLTTFWNTLSRNPESFPNPDSPPLTVSLPQPNPVRSQTFIRLSSQAATHADIQVYDIRGRIKAVVYSGPVEPGNVVFEWNRQDDRGLRVVAGVYFIRVATPDITVCHKILLL